MKKLVFVLIAALSVALTGCSYFESDPIEPKIIGTTFLQEEKGLIFAEFDSVRYAPTVIYVGKKVGRDAIDARIEPIVGMQVTAFTSNIHQKPVFFAGQVTVEQVENYYHKDFTALVILSSICIGLLLLCIIITAVSNKRGNKVVNAHD